MANENKGFGSKDDKKQKDIGSQGGKTVNRDVGDVSKKNQDQKPGGNRK
jgi:hypothetical protein